MAILIGSKSFTEDELATLAKAGFLQIGEKHTPASTTLDAQALHGPFQGNSSQFGALSSPGVRPGRFDAMQRVRSVGSILSLQKSDLHNELLEIKTGVTDSAGTNPTTFCGDPVVYGDLKVCQQIYTWGDIYFKTRLNAAPLLGQRRNRADLPGEFLNAAAVNNPFLPDFVTRITDTKSQLQLETYTASVGLERQVDQVHFLGVAGTQNSTYPGIMTQWKGFDALVSTGNTDNVSGLACPAVDSIVESFDADVAGSDSSGRSIVEAFTDLFYAADDRANSVGMAGVNFAFVLRADTFRRITDAFASELALYRTTSTVVGTPLQRDGMAVQTVRRDMFNGQFIPIDGRQVPVIFSDGIPRETLANNTYKSDVFLLPIDWGGIPLSYAQFFPMDNPYASEFSNFTGVSDKRVMNNGLYMVGKRSTGLCDELHFAARVRLILETPFLAGRLDDVQYVYLAKTRDADPSFSLYADGGATYRL